MVHESRRYHRRRRPTFARGYGMLGSLASGIGEAASTVGTGLESAASSAIGGAGQTALGALGNIGQGLQSLFTSGGGEAGKLAALGQTVPEGVELVGPSSTFAGPGFLQGVVQGFMGTGQQLANPSVGTSLGTGVGQLFDALQQFQQSGGGPAKMPPIVNVGPPMRAPRVIQSPPAQVATGPIMSLLKPIGSL